VRRAGSEVVFNALAPKDVQPLIEALDAFEPGMHIEREQPAADVAAR
jgi:hypothetical protein